MIRILRPTLLIDEEKCRQKIRSMASKAAVQGITFRPHFKTHQSIEIGQWFREEGVRSITVSSIKMAEFFAADGWDDITVAFPLNPLEVSNINELASSITLNLCVVNSESMRLLQSKIKSFINVFIEIDNGYHRTGVRPDQDSLIHGILAVIKESNFVTFAGFLSHAGHAYKARSTSEILNVHDTTKRLMVELGNRYRHEFPNLKLSIGDTPTCSVANDFDGVDEIRPGNFIFYDLTQKEIGSCELSDVSVCMACPIVAVYPERGEMIIHGGAVHFSKDSLTTMGKTVLFGQAVQLTTNGWNRPLENVYLKSLSQEHGILHCPDEMIAHFKVGDIIGVIPVHSCLTADSMGCYQRLTGEKLT